MKQCKVIDCCSTDIASRSALCKTHHNEYTRQHYAENKQYYKNKAVAARAALVNEVNILKNVPCTDCGVKYPPYVMDFDHIDGQEKSDNVSVLIRKGSRSAVMDEIAKCEVVCSNCHRIRTHNRNSGIL